MSPFDGLCYPVPSLCCGARTAVFVAVTTSSPGQETSSVVRRYVTPSPVVCIDVYATRSRVGHGSIFADPIQSNP